MNFLGNICHTRPLEVVALHGDSAVSARLAALGFLPGRWVRLEHVAPLGDPISIAMEGQQISLRRAEAGFVEVREPR